MPVWAASPPDPSLVRHLRFTGKSALAWDTTVEAAVYDVVSGDLAALTAGLAAAAGTCP